MSEQQFLQAELRLLFEYGEHETYEKTAERILKGLTAFSSMPRPVTLADSLDQAGVEVHRVQMLPGGEISDPPTCAIVMMDGAECGYDLTFGGARCVYGHRQ